MGKLLRVGGMRRCYSQAYTPLGYILKGGDAVLQCIPPWGIFSRGGWRGPHAGQGGVTEQSPHCREGVAGGGG